MVQIMRKSFKLILLPICVILFLGITLNIRNVRCYETTKYLGPWDFYIYEHLSLVYGDNLTWSFDTYDDEFEVQVRLHGDDEIELSYGLTENSGIYFVTQDGIDMISFTNMDDFTSGYIDISFEVNAEPSNIIPSYYLIEVILIISIAALIIYSYKKRKVY